MRSFCAQTSHFKYAFIFRHLPQQSSRMRKRMTIKTTNCDWVMLPFANLEFSIWPCVCRSCNHFKMTQCTGVIPRSSLLRTLFNFKKLINKNTAFKTRSLYYDLLSPVISALHNNFWFTLGIILQKDFYMKSRSFISTTLWFHIVPLEEAINY